MPGGGGVPSNCGGTSAACAPASPSPTWRRRGCSGPTQRVNPALIALDVLAVDLVCWCNDLFSYGKESQADPDAHNLVTVLAQGRRRGDEATALRTAAGSVQPGAGDYLDAEEALLRRRDDVTPLPGGPPPQLARAPPTTGQCGLPGTPDRPAPHRWGPARAGRSPGASRCTATRQYSSVTITT